MVCEVCAFPAGPLLTTLSAPGCNLFKLGVRATHSVTQKRNACGITRKLKLTWPSLRSGPRSLTPVVGQAYRLPFRVEVLMSRLARQGRATFVTWAKRATCALRPSLAGVNPGA
jgi:hypothetical protein